jgi:hypothetical protein
MSVFYNQKEKTEICLDIAKKLKFFKNEHGIEVDLFKNDYSFVAKLKGINL